ncbi:MAG: mechanosensitive ion channel family protein [Alphaproteobacteria bacterium]
MMIISRITITALMRTVPIENIDTDEVQSALPRNPYIPAIQRSVQAVLVILAVMALAAAWGVDVLALTNRGSSAGNIARAIFNIVAAVLVADLIWQLARTAIDTRLSIRTEDLNDASIARRNARLQTLLPLLRKFLLVILTSMVGMIILSAIGVDIGPLLAGAGVIGIAIGFGAQALVRDIVSGIFFLVDDAFRIGEYIEIGDLRGTVEGISIRSLRLRHHRGAVHTIPFGEMKSLTNYSRDWAIVKLEFRVPFDTDLKLVKKIVKQIGQELMQNPEIGSNILEPLKSQGVRRMEEYNMVVGVKFTAKPGEQFTIRREAYHRIRDAFDAHGINFASRDVTVRVSPDAGPKEVAKATLAAAQVFTDSHPLKGG